MRTRGMTASDKRRIAAFNTAHPVGTRVRYWSGVRAGDPSGCGVTIAPAGDSPIRDVATVRISRDSGGTDYLALSHVEVVM